MHCLYQWPSWLLLLLCSGPFNSFPQLVSDTQQAAILCTYSRVACWHALGPPARPPQLLPSASSPPPPRRVRQQAPGGANRTLSLTMPVAADGLARCT